MKRYSEKELSSLINHAVKRYDNYTNLPGSCSYHVQEGQEQKAAVHLEKILKGESETTFWQWVFIYCIDFGS